MSPSRTIRRRIHLASSPQDVYRCLTTDDGRRGFWAESAVERDGIIDFVFPSGQRLEARILQRSPPHYFAIEYFGGSHARFELESDGAEGTELTLTETGVPETEFLDNSVGWVSLLMNLKAAVDFSIDLRNGDPDRSWEQGYVDV